MKLALRFIKIGLFFVAMLYICFFLYYKYGWQNHYKKEQIDSHIAEIRNSPTFPDRFYQLYDKSRGDRRERISNRYWRNFWSEFLSIDKPLNDNWEFVAASMIPYEGNRYKIAPMTLAFEFDNSTTPEKCFDYVMIERYKTYSKAFKLNNSITNLTDTHQIVRFIVANENPGFYKRHPTKYKVEIDSLKLIISNTD